MSMDFGKLNFAVGFNRTSAFPLDANSYFESYTDAVEQAATAKAAGSTDSASIAGSTNKNKLTNSQKKLDYQRSGIATRLYNTMGDFKSKVEELAGTSKETNDQSYLGKLITNLQTRMSTFKTQMNAFENALYKKYDSMEMALARLGAQMNYISGN